ncbi:helix-turn-helix transcriptional regulator [Flavihumibacter stibioxidans]|uniref:WYL domain-containing protein n=1 Tax=Flavihumibacter stibioxidans TaxID=1834163 RepID=A0ABR7M861_9BACT|nr:WYL domain-containing protein [Flavihumibacter stibioxidans]MBC6491206.1 hypothetical protein [Flavihumibacter stibioxidans]
MTFQEKIRQYQTLVSNLLEGEGKNRDQLLSALREAGMDISLRTFQRALEELREEYGIHISYDASRNIYSVADAAKPVLEDFMRFCGHNAWTGFARMLLAASPEERLAVSFERGSEERGMHALQPLFRAIVDRKQVRFILENHSGQPGKEYILNPYLLKEYRGNWFLAGMVARNGKIRTYELSRISNLELLQETYQPDKDFPSDMISRFMIGAGLEDGKPEKIVLELYPPADRVLAELPLHATQKKVKSGKDCLQVELRLLVNQDLVEALLQLGDRVKVLEPSALRKALVSRYKDALKLYKK